MVSPVKEHTTLITKQFMANFFLPGHPGAKQLGRPPEPRKMKKTLLAYENEVENYLISFPANETALKIATKSLHTDAVSTTIADYPPNRVLNINPPEIDPTETQLCRKARSELSRLRSGFSRTLNNYMARLDPNIEDKCTQCQASPHDTNHLFTCPAKPSNLF